MSMDHSNAGLEIGLPLGKRMGFFRKRSPYVEILSRFFGFQTGIAWPCLGPAISEPAVLYLDHDGAEKSPVIAESFDEFLEGWEALCYIDIPLLLDFFLDPRTGLIQTESQHARELRELLGVER